jgi:hypothetical protein
MTLVIDAPGKDFLILGADSRGVIDFGSGRTEINIHKKIIKITEHVSIMLYGNSEAGKHLIEKYKSDMNPELQDVRQIADDFCNFCRNEERAIADVPRHPDSWTLFGFLICGIRIEGDKATPLIFTLCNYDGFRLGLCTPFAIKGKIFIAYYLFAKNFNEDMSVNDLSKLVAQSMILCKLTVMWVALSEFQLLTLRAQEKFLILI